MKKEIRYISLAISLVCLWNVEIQAQDMTVKAKAGTVEHTYLKVDLRIKLDSVKVGKREAGIASHHGERKVATSDVSA